MQKHSVTAFSALLALFAHLLLCRNKHGATQSAHLVSFILCRNNVINCLTMGKTRAKGRIVCFPSRYIQRLCRFDICGLLIHDEWLRHNYAQKHPDCHMELHLNMYLCTLMRLTVVFVFFTHFFTVHYFLIETTRHWICCEFSSGDS